MKKSTTKQADNEAELYNWLLTQRILAEIGALEPFKIADLNEILPTWQEPLTDDDFAYALAVDHSELNAAFEAWWNHEGLSSVPLTFAEIRTTAARCIEASASELAAATKRVEEAMRKDFGAIISFVDDASPINIFASSLGFTRQPSVTEYLGFVEILLTNIGLNDVTDLLMEKLDWFVSAYVAGIEPASVAQYVAEKVAADEA